MSKPHNSQSIHQLRQKREPTPEEVVAAYRTVKPHALELYRLFGAMATTVARINRELLCAAHKIGSAR